MGLEIEIPKMRRRQLDSLENFCETIFEKIDSNNKIIIKGFRDENYLRDFEAVLNIFLGGENSENGKYKYSKSVNEASLIYTIRRIS